MALILHRFTLAAYLLVVTLSNDRKLSCVRDGSEDWPMVLREILRLLNGEGQASGLANQLARASASDPQEGSKDCVPGRISLRLLLLLTGSQVSAQDAEQLVGADWYALDFLGWPAVIRSGWPIFRLLRLLQGRMEREFHPEEIGEELIVATCRDSNEPFSILLTRHVRQRHMQEGESLLAASVEYLAKAGISNSGCPLSSAASFLAIAWGRYPVYDIETEDLLRLAQPLVSQIPLSSVLVTRHALLHMLDDMASTYQAFLIDSGALYEDLRPADVSDNPPVDYTRHMMNDRGVCKTGGHVCPWLSLRTPLGYCNPFAYIGTSLSRWRQQGVRLEDVAQALRVSGAKASLKKQAHRTGGSANGPLILLRLVGQELVAVEPKRTEGSGHAGDIESAEVACLAKEVLSLLKDVDLPDFDIVVNLGSRPLLPKRDDNDIDEAHQSRHQYMTALPIFSVCYSSGFWDIPFPSPCARSRCEYATATQARATHVVGKSRKHHVKPCVDLKNGTRACGQNLGVDPDLVNMLNTTSIDRNAGGAEGDTKFFSFALRCYLFQMLASYSDLLSYEPGHVQTAFFGHPVVHAFKARRLKKSVGQLPLSEFATKCRDVIDLQAQ